MKRLSLAFPPSITGWERGKHGDSRLGAHFNTAYWKRRAIDARITLQVASLKDDPVSREAMVALEVPETPHSQRILPLQVNRLVMNADSEYVDAMTHLYEKSLILHDTSQFHPVLYFFFIDALAHLDYTLGILAFNYQSPKNIMTGEYLRWRIDEEKKGVRALFPVFINWLKDEHPERFDRLPTLWRRIYDRDDPATYRSFRIVLDPDSHEPIPATQCFRWTEEFFEKEFLKSLYLDASLSTLFENFRAGRSS